MRASVTYRALRHFIEKEKCPYTRTFAREPRPRYVITLEIAGVVVKYLQWDNDKVWRWTKSAERCSTFLSKEQARSQAENCSMSWQHSYNIRLLE